MKHSERIQNDGEKQEQRREFVMENTISREEAWKLLLKYNQDHFHIQHALTVEGTMKWFAKELGYGQDEEYWGIVGLLHDIDFEKYPQEHCIKPSCPHTWHHHK